MSIFPTMSLPWLLYVGPCQNTGNHSGNREGWEFTRDLARSPRYTSFWNASSLWSYHSVVSRDIFQLHVFRGKLMGFRECRLLSRLNRQVDLWTRPFSSAGHLQWEEAHGLTTKRTGSLLIESYKVGPDQLNPVRTPINDLINGYITSAIYSPT